MAHLGLYSRLSASGVYLPFKLLEANTARCLHEIIVPPPVYRIIRTVTYTAKLRWHLRGQKKPKRRKRKAKRQQHFICITFSHNSLLLYFQPWNLYRVLNRVKLSHSLLFTGKRCWLLCRIKTHIMQRVQIELHFTLHDFLLVAEPGLVLLLSCEELELISSSSSSSSSKFILLDIPAQTKKKK